LVLPVTDNKVGEEDKAGGIEWAPSIGGRVVRCGSTGLGTRELEFDLLSVERGPEGLLVRAKTSAPVVWNIWIRVEPRDIPRLVRLLASTKVLGFAATSLWRSVRPRAVD